jgi:hypothetical protein
VFTALRVCEAFVTSTPSTSVMGNVPRPFVYISAEDIFRPVIPARYIETKREAERGIEEMMINAPEFRGVYIRPSTCCLLSVFFPPSTCFDSNLVRVGIISTPSCVAVHVFYHTLLGISLACACGIAVLIRWRPWLPVV